MTLWFKRALFKGLIGPVAFGVVSIMLCLFYVWLVGTAFSTSALTKSNRIYKNYVEKDFVSEIIADQDTDEKRRAEIFAILSQNNKETEGTFVVVYVKGVISGENFQNIWDQLYIAARLTRNLKAIIFYVDSPGGGVTESDQLYEEIRKIRSRGIKTVVYIHSLSASGAYYLTVASDKIIASPTANTGSIGVIWQMINIEELSRKLGISADTIKSSAMKDIGSPFKTMSGDEKVILQKIVDYNYERFKNIVQKSRGLSDAEINLVATGGIWHADDAKTKKLVDEIGYVNRAVEIAKEITAVNAPVVVTYEKEFVFWDMFGAQSPINSLLNNANNAITGNYVVAPKLLYQWIP